MPHVLKGDFALRLARAYPEANVEPLPDGHFRITMPNGQSVGTTSMTTPYGWRMLRKVIDRLARRPMKEMT